MNDYKRQADPTEMCIADSIESIGLDAQCELVGEEEAGLGLDGDLESSQPTINDIFSIFCRPDCGNTILKAYSECGVFDNEPFVVNFLVGLCGTNHNGSRCYEHFVNALDHVAVVETSCFHNYTTHHECRCQSQLSQVVEDQGCCLDTYHNLISSSVDLPFHYDPRELYEDCHVNLPRGCNNSPISSSTSLASTITTGTTLLASTALALSYP